MKRLPLQIDLYSKTKPYSTVETIQNVESLSILQRVAKGDRTAIQDCIDNYGKLIWAIAKRFTDTAEDAEAVTQEIFLNIWQCAGRFEQTDFDEPVFITLIARRQLKKFSLQSNHSIN
jgi:DNA-directed RNA polymerase specialized sigma24 family protein